MCKQCIRSIRSWMNKQGRTYWDQIILLSHPGWFWWAWVGWTWLPFGPWLSSDLQGTLHSVFKSFWMNCSQESECLNLTPLMSLPSANAVQVLACGGYCKVCVYRQSWVWILTERVLLLELSLESSVHFIRSLCTCWLDVLLPLKLEQVSERQDSKIRWLG
jgi:hypothetical protein